MPPIMSGIDDRLPLRPAAAGGGLRLASALTGIGVAPGALLALLPALLFLPAVLAPPLNHDVAAVLDFSRRWLAGEHLYSDLIDVNPPLIFVLMAIPAALSAWTGIDGALATQLCVLALGAGAWRLSLAARERAAEGRAERAMLDVLPALLLLIAGYDFGQREHLMAVVAFPYLIGAARRTQAEAARPRARLAAAALAAAGFVLKPHFLAIPALVELSVLVARGPRAWVRDAVPWTMAAVGLLYLAALPTLFPDYLNVVVPLVWDFYLGLGGLSGWQVLLVPRMATALAVLAPLLWVAVAAGQQEALARTFALAALGAVAAAVAQHKGWSYHILPVELFTGAAGTVLAARYIDRAALRAPPHAAAFVLGGLMALHALSVGEAPWKELDYANSPAAGLTRLLRQEAAGERVLVLSPGIYPIFPALNDAGVRSTLRTMNMWLLQGAYETCLPDGRRYRDSWEMGRPEFFIYRTVAEDFARAPPAAVVIDRQPGIPWCGEEFDFLAYFRRHPLFAEVWSHYRLAAEWDRYRLYTRKD
jgi:hypothetical protein